MPISHDARDQIVRQLQALTNLCSCRLNAECRALMDSLALRGVLPAAVLEMSDDDWLLACLGPNAATSKTSSGQVG